MHALAGPDESAYEITHRLSCPKSNCRCQQSARKGVGLTHCPAHSDSVPSFNVSVKNGVILFHCQTGCSQESVLESLRERGLWSAESNTSPPVKSEIIATYDYKDAHGNLLYQAVRYVPKDFRQRRPDGKNGWIWNLEGIDRVLFGLPELLAADPKRLRFIVEGEKDVETLFRNGFVATCNVGGAGKWRPEYSEWFHDRDVVLIPDNDEAGKKHMVQVAESLQGIASSIRWLDLPVTEKKFDVTNWFDSGGSPDAFKVLVRDSQFYSKEVFTQRVIQPLSNIGLEQAILAWCFEVRDTVQYLKADDFTDITLRRTLEQFQNGEVIEMKPHGVPEADPGLDAMEAIRSLRELSYRRSSIRIAECILKAANNTDLPFDPCIAADVLSAVCERDSACAGEAPRLSECLNL